MMKVGDLMKNTGWIYVSSQHYVSYPNREYTFRHPHPHWIKDIFVDGKFDGLFMLSTKPPSFTVFFFDRREIYVQCPSISLCLDAAKTAVIQSKISPNEIDHVVSEIDGFVDSWTMFSVHEN